MLIPLNLIQEKIPLDIGIQNVKNYKSVERKILAH